MRLTIWSYYFKLCLKTTKAAHRIQEVKGNKTISDHAAQNWPQNLKSRELSLEIKTRNGQSSIGDYDALKCKVVANPTKSTGKFLEELE